MYDPNDDTDVTSGTTDGAQMERTSPPVRVRERQLQWILLRMVVRRYRVLCRSGEAGTSSRTSLLGIS